MACRRNPDERIINYSACIQRCQNKARKKVYWFVNINISQTHRQWTERIKHFKALDQPVGNETIWLMYITAWPSVNCAHLVIDFFPHRQKLNHVLRCACCIVTAFKEPSGCRINELNGSFTKTAVNGDRRHAFNSLARF